MHAGKNSTERASEGEYMNKWWTKWYYWGLIPAAVAFFSLIAGWRDMSVLQRVNLINFAGLLVHQFEEYGFPGGAPYFLNKYMRGGNERYPLNQLSAMVTNLLIAYICYLLPVFLPDIIWLGLAPALFGCVFQVLLHGVVFLLKFHHFYNPGTAAVFLIHVPCGIFYIYYTVSNSLLTGRDLRFAIAYLLLMIGVTVVFGQLILSSKNSRYPFNEKERVAGERFAKMMGLK